MTTKMVIESKIEDDSDTNSDNTTEEPLVGVPFVEILVEGGIKWWRGETLVSQGDSVARETTSQGGRTIEWRHLDQTTIRNRWFEKVNL